MLRRGVPPLSCPFVFYENVFIRITSWHLVPPTIAPHHHANQKRADLSD